MKADIANLGLAKNVHNYNSTALKFNVVILIGKGFIESQRWIYYFALRRINNTKHTYTEK